MNYQQHQTTRKTQVELSQPFAEHNPSDVGVTCPFIYALSSNPTTEDNTGKWLIFPAGTEVDAAWKTVKRAVETNQLGPVAKVSTARCARRDRYGQVQYVICVYTYNWQDRDDVLRVRETLRALGFTQKLAYKTDADTRAGKYASRGDTNISKYYL